ncbi:alpha/beta fold hydrolase [Serratia plymuthica]|uniref:alpha/beta fold hydrolase n=1 Tax=Serratia plymuthica TaxID=82996 RepID=UPI00141929F4|nr:alpha/beta hydrolase [Serratia plymuthica]NIC28214.1 alpha/beta hydrolase [Serratia plymuthica]
MNDIAIRRGLTEQGEVPIAYEDWGNIAHPPLLLIMGIGAQMLLWPDDFCRALEDMAQDAVHLLDHLQIAQAHVLGASMGGMIAQVLAAEYPQRVKSLTILFSSTNQPLLPPPAPSLLKLLLRRPPANATPQQRCQSLKDGLRALGSPAYPLEEAELDMLVRRLLKRGMDAEGLQRQLSALLGSGDLRRYSHRITAPTLVIHGSADRLVRKAGGVAVARAIAHSQLQVIPKMGHDLPPQLRPQLIEMISAHAAR